MNEITATPHAITHIKKQLAKRGKGIGMRLAVKDAGCTGKKYILDLIDAHNPEDLIYNIDTDLIICVDPTSFVFVAGTQIDYEKKDLNGKFVFHNPNEKAACGCGESFHV
ncbi:MAG TPA: iron-sulfur cluster assembly accessory protein [Gammaproteobacteria bacterium]|nr:iron-sulfur cluster assembly accessory protein [Gammaproteobacteria bacterium]